MHPQNKLTDPDDRTCAQAAPLEGNETFRAQYRSFFDRAEAKRRWSVAESIPWESAGVGGIDETLVEVLESFYATEMFLPDYTTKLLALNRSDQGLAWFLTNWTYEESKHSLAIEQWFVRSGARSEKEMSLFNETLLREEWQLPFGTSRQMLIYALFQELATQLNYINLAKLTAPAKDRALQRTLLLIAGDEGNHHHAFVGFVKTHLHRDREGTLIDLATVLSEFEMPAHELIPDWDRRGRLIEAAGIYSGRIFLRRVLVPGLERLGLDIQTLRPYLKAARS